MGAKNEKSVPSTPDDIGDAPEGYDDMPDPPQGELTDKSDFEDEVLLVASWTEAQSKFTDVKTGAALPPYLIFRAAIQGGTRNGEEVAFAGGVVMDKQARERNGPFRARVSRPKGKRYYVFRSPRESA